MTDRARRKAKRTPRHADREAQKERDENNIGKGYRGPNDCDFRIGTHMR